MAAMIAVSVGMTSKHADAETGLSSAQHAIETLLLASASDGMRQIESDPAVILGKIDLLGQFLLSVSASSLLLEPGDENWQEVQDLITLMNSSQSLYDQKLYREAEISVDEGLKRAPALGKTLMYLDHQIEQTREGKNYRKLFKLVIQLKEDVSLAIAESPVVPEIGMSEEQITFLIKRSKKAIKARDYTAALEYLNQAKKNAVLALKKLGVKDIGTIKKKFQSPMHEYSYVQDLHSIFSMLIGVLILEREIPQTVIDSVQGKMRESTQLVVQSAAFVENSDYALAIFQVKEANLILGKVLQSIGPQFASRH